MTERGPEGFFAWQLDGRGGGRSLGLGGLRAGPTPGPVWVHLDRNDPDARSWLENESGVDEVVHEALLAEETRPRSAPHSDGLLLILRGVNLNPGADPEDMVSLRLWVEADRVIGVYLRRLLAVEDIQTALREGRGPAAVGELLTELADRLVARMAGVLDGLSEAIDEVEEAVLEAPTSRERTRLADLRREAIILRRYLAPQRDVLVRLPSERVDWLGETSRLQLRETADRTLRYVEDLDAIRERAAVTQEQISNGLSEQMNRRMYALSIIAGIFLPLSFVTGLLGVNVAGIPGVEDTGAFRILCGLLVALTAAQLLLFRRLRWL